MTALPDNIKPMPKEISALNTYWLVIYIEQHYPTVNFKTILNQIYSKFPCYIENLETGKIEKVCVDHLLAPRYWFSHRFIKNLHDLIQEIIPDPNLGYKIGSTIYKTQPLLRTTLGVSLLGTQRLAYKVSKEAAKWNQTKEYKVIKTAPGLVAIRVIHNPGIVINDFVMQWNAGCFASYARLAGATDIEVKLTCIDRGPEDHEDEDIAVWDFEITFKEPGLLTRLTKAILYNLPLVRELTDRAEKAEVNHQEQILNRDKIIKKRTDKLLTIQQKLVDNERKIIDQKLQKISLELVTTEERERKSIAEDLHDSVTQLIALSLSKVKVAKNNPKAQEDLVEIESYLEQSLSDIRSLTFQISPPVLYDFGLEAALEWLVTDVNQHHDMEIIFNNFLKSPLNPDQEYKVLLYRVTRELVINIIKHAKTQHGQIFIDQNADNLIVTVEDEGIGFQPDLIPSGFGLASLKDRLNHLHGELNIYSRLGEGTVISLSIPLHELQKKT